MPQADTILSHEDSIKKLRELMKDIKFCMLTTRDPAGHLHSRPMTIQEAEFDGDLWFFTSRSGHLASEIQKDAQVCVCFSKPADNDYVSISGRAELVADREKLEKLWNPINKAWFPKGLDDPELALLRVDAEHAEYWDSPSSTVAYAFGLLKALATGKQADIGEHRKLDL